MGVGAGPELKPTDAELLEAARMGSEKAFEALVDRYFGTVYAVAYARLGQREAAEDLAQEVFLRAYLRIEKLQDVRCLSAWLCRIAQNLAIDWLRKGESVTRLATMVPMEGANMELADPNEKNGRERIEGREQNQALYQAIFHLPPEQREAVLLHYLEGLKQNEIASRLGLHPATVGRHLKRALAALKENLEPILRESASALGSSRRAKGQAVALIAGASAMAAASKSALAAADGTVTANALGSVVSAIGSSGAASSSGILHSIFTWFATGAKIMGTGKAVGVVATVLIVAGGALLYSQAGEEGKDMSQKSGDQEMMSNSGKGGFISGIPKEAFGRIMALHKEGLAKMDPSGDAFDMTKVITVRGPKDAMESVLLGFKNTEKDKSGEIFFGNANTNPVSISDEEGRPMKFRVDETLAAPYKNKHLLTLNQPWKLGERKTFCMEFPFGKGLSDDGMEMRAETDGSVSLKMATTIGMAGVPQFFVLIPSGYRMKSSSAKPSVEEKVGDYSICGWRKRVNNEPFEIKVSMDLPR